MKRKRDLVQTVHEQLPEIILLTDENRLVLHAGRDYCYLNHLRFLKPGLHGVDFHKIGYDADLPEANLGSANLSNAVLHKVDFSGAYLGDADLSEADVQDTDFSEAYLDGTDLSGVDLQEVDLSEPYLTDLDSPND